MAIQEVKRETGAVRALVDDFPGPEWDLILTDVTAGDAGNTERLGFVFDRRRLRSSGLAGEIVLPPGEAGDPTAQFDRTPYIVAFDAGDRRFSLVTAHIKYGDVPEERGQIYRRPTAVSVLQARDPSASRQQRSGWLACSARPGSLLDGISCSCCVSARPFCGPLSCRFCSSTSSGP